MHSDNVYHVTAAGGIAYFGSPVDNKVYAIDVSSGEERWTFFTDGPVRFAPTIFKNRVYAGSDDGHVYCLHGRTGKLIRKYRAGPSHEKMLGMGRMVSLWPVRTSILLDEWVAYFAAGIFPYEGLYICALDAYNGSVAVRQQPTDSVVTAPLCGFFMTLEAPMRCPGHASRFGRRGFSASSKVVGRRSCRPTQGTRRVVSGA